MRSVIIATILCLSSAPAFACMYDTDCKTGSICISGTCTPAHSSDEDNDAPAPAKRVTKGKVCYYSTATPVHVASRAQAQTASA